MSEDGSLDVPQKGQKERIEGGGSDRRSIKSTLVFPQSFWSSETQAPVLLNGHATRRPTRSARKPL
jgi:hypothetical protein